MTSCYHKLQSQQGTPKTAVEELGLLTGCLSIRPSLLLKEDLAVFQMSVLVTPVVTDYSGMAKLLFSLYTWPVLDSELMVHLNFMLLITMQICGYF